MDEGGFPQITISKRKKVCCYYLEGFTLLTIFYLLLHPIYFVCNPNAKYVISIFIFDNFDINELLCLIVLGKNVKISTFFYVILRNQISA